MKFSNNKKLEYAPPPTDEEARRVARLINSYMKNHRVTSVSGVPVDENGNPIPKITENE
jgi:hypothetical protein